MTHPPHSNKERPFLPRINDGGILSRFGEMLAEQEAMMRLKDSWGDDCCLRDRH